MINLIFFQICPDFVGDTWGITKLLVEVLVKTSESERLTLQGNQICVPSEYFIQISILRKQTIVNKLPSYREQSIPTRLRHCTLCNSRNTYSFDSCNGINTESNRFYVSVAGMAIAYTNGELIFTGNNLLKVERVERSWVDDVHLPHQVAKKQFEENIKM